MTVLKYRDPVTREWIPLNVGSSGINEPIDQPTADALYVNLTGDTMTGPLILSDDPITQPKQAVTKEYVDLGSGVDTRYVNIIGDTMTGELLVPVTPTQAAAATSKSYVDARIWYGTRAQYDAIVTKDPTVLYCVGG